MLASRLKELTVCAFCLKSEQEVGVLIGGKSPGVKICQGCAELVVAVFHDEEMQKVFRDDLMYGKEGI